MRDQTAAPVEVICSGSGKDAVCRQSNSKPKTLYALSPDYWGQRLASEAARAALRYGFRSQLFRRVHARTDKPNQASVRVQERLGMKFDGETSVNGRPYSVLLRFTIARSLRRGSTATARAFELSGFAFQNLLLSARPFEAKEKRVQAAVCG